MKTLNLIGLILFALLFSYCSKELNEEIVKNDFFITTWDTTLPGTSDELSIMVPIDTDNTYYDIDWENDGIFDEIGVSGPISHTYQTPGVYTVAIKGESYSIIFAGEGDCEKIVSIDNWGKNKWVSFELAFAGANNLTYNASDVPNLANVYDMEGMFFGASKFNGDISNWDVSNVRNMSGMFFEAKSFNQNLNDWDVSKVSEMSFMFCFATKFNGNLGSWNVSNVTDMTGMFAEANNFNNDISNWNVSNVTSMLGMFESAYVFNQNLGDWNIENVLYMDLMLSDSGMSTKMYDETLKGWSERNLSNYISLGAIGLTYCESKDAREYIINNFNWSISGDMYDCSAN